MSHEHYFVACPGVLGVRTNIENFKWSFGTSMPPASREEYEACDLRFRVESAKNLPQPAPQHRIGKYHYWSGASGRDAIYYDRSFLMGARLRLEATDLLGDEPVVRVNETYRRRISHRFMNLHSLGYILTDLAGLLMLHRGFAPLHCSAFRCQDSTVVIAAPPNTGKTLTSMMACMQHEADYIAEDLAVTDGANVYSVPWTSTFRYYKQVDKSFFSKAKNWATKLVPPLELLGGSKPNPITEYVETERMVAKSPVTHIVMLQRGDESVHAVDETEAFRKVRNLNRYEFNYHRAPLVVAHEFFNPQLDIEGACRAEDQILTSLMQNVDHRLVVQSTDPTRYTQLILDAIQNEFAPANVRRQVA